MRRLGLPRTRLIFLALTVSFLPACSYSLARQIEDVEKGIYKIGKTSQEAIRVVYGEPDRVAAGTFTSMAGHNRSGTVHFNPGEVPVEVWYYDEDGMWFHFGQGGFTYSWCGYQYEALSLTAWGEIPLSPNEPRSK